MPALAATLFSAFASLLGFMMVVVSVANELIRDELKSYLYSTYCYFFNLLSPNLTLAIYEMRGITRNQVYEAAEQYLRARINPKTKRLSVSRTRKEEKIKISLEKGETVVDQIEDVQLTWKFVCKEDKRTQFEEKRLFELSFDMKHKEKVLEVYLPHVLEEAERIKNEDKAIKLYSHQCPYDDERRGSWGYVILDHPATFDTVAMDPDLKRTIIGDLDRFLGRKEYYKKVGKAWKRGYLLDGPPGTGKSSLVAAMANYLKFDIYDLQLTSVSSDAGLRKALLSTSNRSILLIEDIDCSSEFLERKIGMKIKRGPGRDGLTLSGILNCIDGLWSSCGDERIFVFTTNCKDQLDPALLRPGRVDLRIEMSYCTIDGFKLLASTYLGIGREDNPFFREIDELLKSKKVSPAEVAEELMNNADADADAGAALQGFVKFLKCKRDEINATESGEVLSVEE